MICINASIVLCVILISGQRWRNARTNRVLQPIASVRAPSALNLRPSLRLELAFFASARFPMLPPFAPVGGRYTQIMCVASKHRRRLDATERPHGPQSGPSCMLPGPVCVPPYTSRCSVDQLAGVRGRPLPGNLPQLTHATTIGGAQASHNKKLPPLCGVLSFIGHAHVQHRVNIVRSIAATCPTTDPTQSGVKAHNRVRNRQGVPVCRRPVPTRAWALQYILQVSSSYTTPPAPMPEDN